MFFFFFQNVCTDKPQAYRSDVGHQQGGRGHRFVGVLSQRGMGHPGRASRETREVLSLLPGTLRRHILQHNPETPDVVLHGQSDRAVRGHILPVGAGVLPASRLQREDLAVHHHPPVADHVLPAHIGNHTVHVAVVTAAWQVPAVHYVAGGPVRGRHHHHYKHTLPVSGRQSLERIE